MVSTLVPVLIVSAVYLVVFLVFRKSNRRFYAPRTYLGSLREQLVAMHHWTLNINSNAFAVNGVPRYLMVSSTGLELFGSFLMPTLSSTRVSIHTSLFDSFAFAAPSVS